jgi:hypothetical protein
MNREQLTSSIRVAVYGCGVTLEHCNKTTAGLLDVIDAYVAHVTEKQTFYCHRCYKAGDGEVTEEVAAAELAQVGPPHCGDCGELMTLEPLEAPA